MELKLKGFPNEISDYIETPDMAELLLYPNFYGNTLEDIRKHGTEFQKKMVDKIPLKNTKKNIFVETNVRFLIPGSRAVTMSNKDTGGWHSDSQLDLNLYHKETDITHLFLTKSSSMTEFLKEDKIVNFNVNRDAQDYFTFVYSNWNNLGLESKPAPSNRFVTFTNHLHRAQPVQKIEFRYMFRVVESDGDLGLMPNQFSNHTFAYDQNNNWVPNITREKEKIVIYIQKSL